MSDALDAASADWAVDRRLLAQAQGLARFGVWVFDPVAESLRGSAVPGRGMGAGSTETLTLAQALERVHPEDHERVRSFLRALPQAGEAQILLRLQSREHGELHVRVRGRAATGPLFPAGLDKESSGSTPVDSQAGSERLRLYGYIQDVTELRTVHAALRQSEELLRASRRAETAGRVAAAVAHDMNNLLAAIVGYASLLQLQSKGDGTALRSVDRILESAARAATLTERLVQLHRGQGGALQRRSLSEALKTWSDALRATLPAGIEFTYESPAEELWAKLDANELAHALDQLVRNALESMGARPGTLSIRTRAVQRSDGGLEDSLSLGAGSYAAILISDSGPGLSREQLGLAFDPFFTTHPERSAMGLGLSVARGIVREHGGDLVLESEPGGGARACLFLPLTPQGEARPAPPTPRPPPAAKPVRPARILLVEDDEMVRALVEQILEPRGYSVRSVGTAEDALVLIQEEDEPLDLLITDIVLPRMGGEQLGPLARAQRPGLAILFISAFAGGPREASAAIGATLLRKPFRPDDLLAAVQQALPTSDPTLPLAR